MEKEPEKINSPENASFKIMGVFQPPIMRSNSLPNLKEDPAVRKVIKGSTFKRSDSVKEKEKQKKKEKSKVLTPKSKARMTKRLSIKAYPLNMDAEMYYWILDSIPYFDLFKKELKVKPPKSAKLPKTHRKYTLFLDLDSVLICNISAMSVGISKMLSQLTEKLRISFIARPLIDEFLSGLEKTYEIYIFTTEKRKYAEDFLHSIEPTRKLIRGVLSEECCSVLLSGKKHYMFKQLDCISNRDKSNIVVVDYNLKAWPYDVQNLVPISPYSGDSHDTQLPKLAGYLLTLPNKGEDLRDVIKNTYPIQQYITELQKEVMDMKK